MLQRTCPILSRAGPSRDCESHSECLVIYPQPLATGQCCDGVAAHVPDFSDALDHLAIAISYYLHSTSSHREVLRRRCGARARFFSRTGSSRDSDFLLFTLNL